MSEAVVIALISLLGTVGGSFAGVMATSKLSNYRIEQLEKKVDKHNNLIERVYNIEQSEAVMNEKIEVANHRISDLESN